MTALPSDYKAVVLSVLSWASPGVITADFKTCLLAVTRLVCAVTLTLCQPTDPQDYPRDIRGDA